MSFKGIFLDKMIHFEYNNKAFYFDLKNIINSKGTHFYNIHELKRFHIVVIRSFYTKIIYS